MLRSINVTEPSHNSWPKGGGWDICLVEMNRGNTSNDRGDWLLLPQTSIAQIPYDYTGYNPYEINPQLFLSFARLGRTAWKQFEGEYLYGWHWIANPIPKTIAEQALEFVEEFGPPLFHPSDAKIVSTGSMKSGWNDMDDYDGREFAMRLVSTPKDTGEFLRDVYRIGNCTTEQYLLQSLGRMLAEAQLVEVAFRYLRVLTGEENVSALGAYVREIYRIEKEGMYRELEGLEPDTHDNIVKIAARLVEKWLSNPNGLPGVKLGSDRNEFDDGTTEWRTVVLFDRLINFMWYQVHRALVKNSLIRTCGNENCHRKFSLFEPTRPNQSYCSKTCRDAQNSREYRGRRLRTSSREDILE